MIFIIKENNPCYSSYCYDIEWDKKESVSNMSNNCKLNVSNYCEINKDIDNSCGCWKSKNKYKPECIEFRKQFQNPDNTCNIKDFKITEHPDFKNYIKKDSIPCWGCNIP